MLTQQEILNWGSKLWVYVFIPVIYWINRKCKEYITLVRRVETLEGKLDSTNTKIDERFDTVNLKIDEDRVERKHTSAKIDEIHSLLYQVKEDTAINSSKLK